MAVQYVSGNRLTSSADEQGHFGLHPLRETVKKVNKVGVNPRGELHHASRTQEIYARTQSESCTVI